MRPWRRRLRRCWRGCTGGRIMVRRREVELREINRNNFRALMALSSAKTAVMEHSAGLHTRMLPDLYDTATAATWKPKMPICANPSTGTINQISRTHQSRSVPKASLQPQPQAPATKSDHAHPRQAIKIPEKQRPQPRIRISAYRPTPQPGILRKTLRSRDEDALSHSHTLILTGCMIA